MSNIYHDACGEVLSKLSIFCTSLVSEALFSSDYVIILQWQNLLVRKLESWVCRALREWRWAI